MSTDAEMGRRLISAALAHLRAAELLHEDDPKGLAWPVCYVEIGLALELGLKGFLRAGGGTAGEQRKLGHNLKRLWRRVQTGGYTPSSPHAATLIEDLAKTYQDMTLRYIEGEELNLMRLQDVIQVCRAFLLELLGLAFPRVAPV